MNIASVMQQAKQMQEQMQKRMAEMRVEASAGGGSAIQRVRKRLERIRLEQQVELALLHVRCGFDVTGRQHDWECREAASDLSCELQSADTAGHHDVRHHEIDGAAVGQRAAEIDTAEIRRSLDHLTERCECRCG